MLKTKKFLWLIWLLITLVIATFYLYTIYAAEDKTALLIGETTHGHHQIEMSCNSCHTDAFGAGPVLQDACTNCHQEELDAVDDSHPIKKFTNPRNADLLKTINAKQCVSCHTEHHKDKTHPMGVTVPQDVCMHCHLEVGENRPSHKDLGFETCATAGCHNYHDNTALYENFLVKHAGGQWLNKIGKLPDANAAALDKKIKISDLQNMSKSMQTLNASMMTSNPEPHGEWLNSAHAKAQVQCVNCHTEQDTDSVSNNAEWIEKPGIESCQSCHAAQYKGFTEGKHGMRLSPALASELTPMSPSEIQPDSHLAFKDESKHKELTCNSCHSAHEYDTQTAAVESCIGCHADDHSNAFADSPHGNLWQQFQQGQLDENSTVTCATCHLPRVKVRKGQDGEPDIYRVEHNQNLNLRPNEKMIRTVCLTCHNLEFSIDALADPELIKTNFAGKPSKHIESIDWAMKRQ